MKIYLIRHGEKEGHGFEANLTDTGRNQIKNLSKKIKKLPIKKIYSSSNPRSIESAEIIAKEIGSEVNIIKEIEEFEREFFFLKIEEINEIEKVNFNNLKDFIKKIIEKGENVLLVMNAGINRAIICSLIGIPLNKAISLTQNFSSLSELELKEINGEKIWCINNLNNIEHLNGNTEEKGIKTKISKLSY